MDAKRYRIYSPEGEHVATVLPEHVKENLELYNSRRVLDIDGNPVGECRAEPYDGFVQGPVVKTAAFTGRGPRREPITPAPGVTFYDIRRCTNKRDGWPGDRVRVTISGRTGEVARIVAWDEPMYGVTEGRVAWSNLEPETKETA